MPILHPDTIHVGLDVHKSGRRGVGPEMVLARFHSPTTPVGAKSAPTRSPATVTSMSPALSTGTHASAMRTLNP